MKTKAAVMGASSGDFEITQLKLDPPKANEVLVRFEYAGLCHSDKHPCSCASTSSSLRAIPLRGQPGYDDLLDGKSIRGILEISH